MILRWQEWQRHSHRGIVLPFLYADQISQSENCMLIQISPVTPTDIEALVTLARVIWHESYAEIITQAQIDYMLEQRYNTPRLHAELAIAGVWWDKATVDNHFVAFASTLLTDTPGEMKIDKLYVAPARQRLGLGGRLIDHLSERALVQGCTTLILAVNKRNERAIGAYSKHGFIEREAVRVDIGNGFVMDDFIMAKSLR
jgi:diamine N-acetyltransferase